MSSCPSTGCSYYLTRKPSLCTYIGNPCNTRDELCPVLLQGIDDAESEWSQHHAKRLIDTRAKGLRGSIPPNFPYFHVEFGLTGASSRACESQSEEDHGSQGFVLEAHKWAQPISAVRWVAAAVPRGINAVCVLKERSCQEWCIYGSRSTTSRARLWIASRRSRLHQGLASTKSSEVNILKGFILDPEASGF